MHFAIKIIDCVKTFLLTSYLFVDSAKFKKFILINPGKSLRLRKSIIIQKKNNKKMDCI